VEVRERAVAVRVRAVELRAHRPRVGDRTWSTRERPSAGGLRRLGSVGVRCANGGPLRPLRSWWMSCSAPVSLLHTTPLQSHGSCSAEPQLPGLSHCARRAWARQRAGRLRRGKGRVCSMVGWRLALRAARRHPQVAQPLARMRLALQAAHAAVALAAAVAHALPARECARRRLWARVRRCEPSGLVLGLHLAIA
jgi:hypothetical protein